MAKDISSDIGPDMWGVTIKEPGGPDVLTLGRLPIPAPGPGEVLIKVAAAGVNRPDCLQRAGLYPPPPGASPLPGLEVAGEIVAIGESSPDTQNSTQWQVGDQATALTPGGGYAGYALAPIGHILPIPGGLDLVHAAALPETTFTVYSNLFMRGRLSAGETVLIHGGSSGIGTTAIQLAHLMGATVFTTARTTEKCAACRKLGATEAFNYAEEDWVNKTLEATDGRGVDMVVDMVGAPYFDSNLSCLAMDGRLVVIAVQKGSQTDFDMRKLMLKRHTIMGSTLRPQSVEAKNRIAQGLKRDVWPLIEQGKMGPILHKSFPCDQAADAHRLMESNQHIGKIVLTF